MKSEWSDAVPNPKLARRDRVNGMRKGGVGIFLAPSFNPRSCVVRGLARNTPHEVGGPQEQHTDSEAVPHVVRAPIFRGGPVQDPVLARMDAWRLLPPHYRTTSLIRNRTPFGTAIGPYAYAYCRVLGAGVLL